MSRPSRVEVRELKRLHTGWQRKHEGALPLENAMVDLIVILGLHAIKSRYCKLFGDFEHLGVR